jgi:hypothetical protein
VLGVAAVCLFLLWGLWSATRVRLTSTGLERHDALTFDEARQVDLRIAIHPTKTLDAARLTLDGRPLDQAERVDGGFRWRPAGALMVGEHQLVLTVPRPILPPARFTWKLLVDATPPTLRAPSRLAPRGMRTPVRIDGRVDPDALLTANGNPVELDDDGRFTLRYPRPPAGPVLLVARDEADNVVKQEVFVPVRRPAVHGVHMTAISWRTPSLKRHVLDLIDAGRIDTVQLDLKDEHGDVGYDSKVPLAQQIGAVRNYYGLRQAVNELHRRGVRVIGRIVVYRDPILAKAAWEDGHRDWVVQKTDGSPHGAYGGFTNLASRAVQQYNLDIAAEAADLGVDEILWDYIRRPEDQNNETIDDVVFPGMPSTHLAVRRAVVGFLARGHEILRAKGVYQGASLFGVAARRPDTVGQSVPDIARHVDYIAPMVYPALWVSGEFSVGNPVGDPYTIVARSLQAFKDEAEGTGIGFTPWLQDFSLGVTYGDREVAAQVTGARAAGVEDFLLWSPRVQYHADRLPRLGRS